MARTRGILLVLFLITVSCVVVIQVVLDGWTLRGNINWQPFTASKGEICQNISAINASKVFKSTILSKSSTTIKSTEKLITAKSSTLPNVLSNPVKSTTTKHFPQIKLKTKLRKGMPHNKTFAAKRNRLLMPLDKKMRLEDVIRRNEVIQRRLKADPMRAIKTIPIVNPDNVTRIFLLTYFRSGSSFVGELLQQNWKTFYQFEPLHYMTYDSRIGLNRTREAFDLFDAIFNCNLTNVTDYFEWVKKPRNQFLFSHSYFLSFSCRTNRKSCFDPAFVSAVCRRAPVQVIKSTRLQMRQLKEFVEENENLGIKVVFLTRDPRGIVTSRWTLDWCNATRCSDPKVLCNEMADDISVFDELRERDPTRFIRIRYEDITMNPKNETIKLFKFLNIPFSLSVQKFLRTHTTARKVDNLNPYSTRRNTLSMALSWQHRVTFEQVETIQESCSNVMKELNYTMITSPQQLPTTPKPVLMVQNLKRKGKLPRKVSSLKKNRNKPFKQNRLNGSTTVINPVVKSTPYLNFSVWNTTSSNSNNNSVTHVKR